MQRCDQHQRDGNAMPMGAVGEILHGDLVAAKGALCDRSIAAVDPLAPHLDEGEYSPLDRDGGRVQEREARPHPRHIGREAVEIEQHGLTSTNG
jgi:hypothetical protein